MAMPLKIYPKLVVFFVRSFCKLGTQDRKGSRTLTWIFIQRYFSLKQVSCKTANIYIFGIIYFQLPVLYFKEGTSFGLLLGGCTSSLSGSESRRCRAWPAREPAAGHFIESSADELRGCAQRCETNGRCLDVFEFGGSLHGFFWGILIFKSH